MTKTARSTSSRGLTPNSLRYLVKSSWPATAASSFLSFLCIGEARAALTLATPTRVTSSVRYFSRAVRPPAVPAGRGGAGRRAAASSRVARARAATRGSRRIGGPLEEKGPLPEKGALSGGRASVAALLVGAVAHLAQVVEGLLHPLE